MATAAVRDTRTDRIFNVFNYTILTAFLLIVLYPLIYIVSASLSSPQAVSSGQVWLWPVEPTLLAYQTIFKDPTDHDRLYELDLLHGRRQRSECRAHNSGCLSALTEGSLGAGLDLVLLSLYYVVQWGSDSNIPCG